MWRLPGVGFPGHRRGQYCEVRGIQMCREGLQGPGDHDILAAQPSSQTHSQHLPTRRVDLGLQGSEPVLWFLLPLALVDK